MSEPVHSLTIPGLTPYASGKVREVFDLGETLLIVVTDRVSAYDSVMPTPIESKGRVLNALSRYWFRQLRPLVSTHYITTDTDYICTQLSGAGVAVTPELRTALDGRSMLVIRAAMLPIECVVRGYLSGSLYAEYVRADGPHSGALIHGRRLPPGLRESDRLPEPIFTPSTKAESGHDINISVSEMAQMVGPERAAELERVSIAVYSRASELALRRGIIIADTKFEFGLHLGVLTLADEVLTPDSSRFWDAERYTPGKPQDSYDKQYLRDWLVDSGWNREPPAPTLPPEVARETANRYVAAYEKITGESLPDR